MMYSKIKKKREIAADMYFYDVPLGSRIYFMLAIKILYNNMKYKYGHLCHTTEGICHISVVTCQLSLPNDRYSTLIMAENTFSDAKRR